MRSVALCDGAMLGYVRTTKAERSAAASLMRIHLHLSVGEYFLTEGMFETPTVTIATKNADFTHEMLPVSTRLTILTDGYHAVLHDGESTRRLRRTTLLEVGNQLRLRIMLFPHPDAVPAERGACPSCGGKLSARHVGGAYRSVAREQMRCADCGTTVLQLENAPAVLGRFLDRSEGDWVHVSVPNRCPRCTAHMLRSVFATEHGETQVERCGRCHLVAIEPEDEARLLGRA